jgi:hypoxanthine phosphoribosyltransferase
VAPSSTGRTARPLAEIAYTADQIQARVAELAAALGADLEAEVAAGTGSTEAPPLLVSVLKGSVMFLADLVRKLPIEAEVDFMSISKYAGPRASGVVRIVKDLEQPLDGRHVVLVEDIVDTGLSLSYLVRTLMTRSPASLRVCTLIDKRVLRIAELPVHYSGFETDSFLIGYGLDIQGFYRNLPYLMAVSDVAALAAAPDRLVPELFPGALTPPPAEG